MILIDPREGSKDFEKPLRDALVPCRLQQLEFGDFAFIGRGTKGAEVSIGVEHKRLGDFVQSLSTERLAGHQLPGLVTDYDRPYLILEGEWEHNKEGRVVEFIKDTSRKRRTRGAPPAVEFEIRLLTLETRGGLHIRHCNTRRDSVRYLISLYRFWTDKDLDQHKSHLAIHAPDVDPSLGIPISTFRRAVAQLPGVGFKTSAAVERTFGGSFRRMMLATEATWAEIVTKDDAGKTRKLGAAKARAIMEALQ